MMQTRGVHLLAEYHGCDRERLDDLDFVERLLPRAAVAAGATVVTSAFHRYAPQGVSGVVVVEESHISIHTWPEHGYAAVDFYTCGDCQPEQAHPIIAAGLRATGGELMRVRRGLDGSGPGMRVERHVAYGGHLERTQLSPLSEGHAETP